MIELKKIFSECFVDTLLVRLIVGNHTSVHRAGITEVAKGLTEYEEDNFIIGVIDTDKFKRDPPSILAFSEEVANLLQSEGLIIKKVPDCPKYVIRLHPAFERWIWRTAQICKIDTTRYGYNRWQDLKKIAKTEDVYDNINLVSFIKEVIEANPPAIQTLRYWLNKANNEN